MRLFEPDGGSPRFEFCFMTYAKVNSRAIDCILIAFYKKSLHRAWICSIINYIAQEYISAVRHIFRQE